MNMWRRHRSALAFEAAQQARKNSAEEYLHPFASTYRFKSPTAILHAEQRHVLKMIPVDAKQTHVAISGTLGAEARKLGRARRLYRALRPQAPQKKEPSAFPTASPTRRFGGGYSRNTPSKFPEVSDPSREKYSASD